MKTFKNIAYNIQSLQEGFFDLDGDDRLESAISKDANEDFLKNCKGDFKTVSFKDGSIRINGRLIIKTDSEGIYLNCRDFHGTLIIENCPKLKTLKDSFLSEIVVFDGNITINQCPSLESLEGLPDMIKGNLSITNCKKIKDFGTVDSVFGNVYWSGNGKKYTEDQIRQKVHIIKRVFCGTDEELANLNEDILMEAFNNPWLSKIAKQLKNSPWLEREWKRYDGTDPYVKKTASIDNFFQSVAYGRNMMLSDLDFNNVIAYDMGNEKEKKNFLDQVFIKYNSKSSSITDRFAIACLFDESKNKFIKAYGDERGSRGTQTKFVTGYRFPIAFNKETHSEGDSYRSFSITKTEFRNEIDKLGDGYTMVVIFAKGSNDERRKMQSDRAELKKGVITPGDAKQYQEIAKANIARYKEIIRQNKLNKKSENGEYQKAIDAVERIMTRSFKLSRKLMSDPKGIGTSRYTITSFLNWLRDEQRMNSRYTPSGKNGPQYYGEYGLMYYFKVFMESYGSVYGSSSTPDKYYVDRLEQNYKSLMNAIKIADEKLTGFGV